jgi:hypothetical protein
MKFIPPIFLVLLVLKITAQQKAFNLSFMGSNSGLVNKQANDDFRFSSTNIEVSNAYGSGISFGLERQYKNNMLFEWGFQANRLGYKVSGYDYYRYLGIYEETIFEYYQNYIGVPIKGGYSVGKKVFGFIKLGLIPSVLVSSQTFVTRSGESNNPSLYFQFSPFKLNIFGSAEIGGGFLVGRKINIFSSFAYQESLINLVFNNVFPRSDSKKLYALSLALGVKYLIVK